MESTPSPRQTVSYIRSVLASRGISPKSKMGQNFLIDLNLLELIVSTAQLDRQDCVLEVGTGTGSLTANLADHAGAVVSVELDADFHRMARELLAGRQNISLLHADVLARKNETNPAVLAEWDRMTRQFACTRRKLVANLPYVVATPVIANLLIGQVPIERMVVMTQWELAERMTAAPATKQYGALAVLVQSLAEVSVVRRLAPSVFWPRPQVDSAIVLIRPIADKRMRVGDPVQFRNFLRDLYTHRRKNLRQALAALPEGRKDKKEVDNTLTELRIDRTLRAEALDVDQHLRLCAAFGGSPRVEVASDSSKARE
jgi:16S rRNA (adenine1518-N6/adenine1519-N6)-dimethyltransferase